MNTAGLSRLFGTSTRVVHEKRGGMAASVSSGVTRPEEVVAVVALGVKHSASGEVGELVAPGVTHLRSGEWVLLRT